MDFNEKPQFIQHPTLIDQHIKKHFRHAEVSVFHEIPTLDIHMDVYHIKPKNASYEVLLTAGMSALAMNVREIPKDAGKYQFAELMALIPKGVDFGEMYPSGTKYDWIIRMIKASAKFPHFYDTWIGPGHSIQAHETMEPYSGDTAYCGCMVLPTVTFNEDFKTVKSPDGVINIYSLFPLYREELEFKIQHGFNEFLKFLNRHNAKEIIDFDRRNYCKKRSSVFGKLTQSLQRIFSK